MYNKATNITTNLGTINDTQIKLPNGNNTFLVFETHHDNITSIISIVCNTNSDIDFMVDSISQDTKKYVSIQIMMCRNKYIFAEISEVTC